MANGSLTQFYDKLKSDLDVDKPKVTSPVAKSLDNPATALAWRNKAAQEADKLRNDCCRKIIIDIYTKTVPFDQPYVDGNRGTLANDVDKFMQSKNTTPYQYLRSAYESTKAPLLEFLLRSADNMGKRFMMEADETLKDAKENKLDVPDPKAEIDSEENKSQLVDVSKDMEYQNFIDKLKEKTVNKIVSDISKVINDKKEDKRMEFNTTPPPGDIAESVVAVGLDYLSKKYIQEGVDISEDMREEHMGLAIREACLNQLDLVFDQPSSEFKEVASKIRFGKGVLINESDKSFEDFHRKMMEDLKGQYDKHFGEFDKPLSKDKPSNKKDQEKSKPKNNNVNSNAWDMLFPDGKKK